MDMRSPEVSIGEASTSYSCLKVHAKIFRISYQWIARDVGSEAIGRCLESLESFGRTILKILREFERKVVIVFINPLNLTPGQYSCN